MIILQFEFDKILAPLYSPYADMVTPLISSFQERPSATLFQQTLVNFSPMSPKLLKTLPNEAFTSDPLICVIEFFNHR